MLELDELKTKATELEIDFEDDVTAEDLEKKITEKEEENNKNSDPDYLKGEAKKAFEKRDKANKARLAAENEAKKLREKIKNTVDKAEYDDLHNQLKELREQILEREEREEKERLAKASETEREQMLKDKETRNAIKALEDKINKLEKVKEETEAEVKKERETNRILRSKALDSEIFVAAERGNALRPSQIVRLLKEDFEWDDTQHKYVYVERDERGKERDILDVDEYVKAFLEKEENDNLVKSNIQKQSLHSKRGDNDQDTTKKKDKDYKPTGKHDPKDPALIKEAQKQGVSVERLIMWREKRDARYKQKEELAKK